tara:strand:+ start:201 stop:791 length:591 start_codon:yes stop_codon:yes gene_type:complete
MNLASTFLVQELENPLPLQKSKLKDVARAFGGFHTCSDELWDLLHSVCTLKYMGAAEYEFGQLSSTFSALSSRAKDGQLQTFTFSLSPSQRKLNSLRKYLKKGEKAPSPEDVTIWGIAPKVRHSLYVERAKDIASGAYESYIKNFYGCDAALDPIRDFDNDTVGWVEESNNFVFFSNKDMFDRFCHLFGIKEVPGE